MLALVAAGCGDDDEGDTSSAAAEATSAAAEASSAVAEATSEAESVASEVESAASSAVEEATSAAEEGSSAAESGAAPSGKIGVILPDTKSSVRWESFDRPYLEEAFKAAGVEYEIQNAEGDKNRMATIADQMITSGVTVLMIVNLDSESGAAIEQKAADAGIKTIDYDRLTLNGLADVYVSFDGVKVGEAQGDGLIKCITDKGVEKPAIAVLNGSPTDNNATLFKQGYDSKINPKFDAGEWTEVDDQSVPDWDNQKGGQIYEQMLTKANGKIDGVLAANDGLANAVIAVNKKNNLQIPVTGQDATPEGLRNILAGDQCMTVYKAVKKQAAAAADAAVALLNGETPDTGGTTIEDTESGRQVPAVLLDVQPIYKDNVKDVIDDGFVAAADVCTPELADACAEAGIG
jgi:D-xylose transport system substrate-binding protein